MPKCAPNRIPTHSLSCEYFPVAFAAYLLFPYFCPPVGYYYTMERLFYFLSFIFVSLSAKAQLNCTFAHYSQENGLSENSVMDMVQDHDGMIWFATWDGISRFDGYDFKVYKARKENDVSWTSNRVEDLDVDKYGDVWCVTYDGHAFRFDKRMETFVEVPSNGLGKDLSIISIIPLDNGTVWLLTDNNGGIRVTSDSKTGQSVAEIHLSNVSKGRATKIFTVFLDSKGREWLLTENGLLRIEGTGSQAAYFVNAHSNSIHSDQSFFSALQIGQRIYFASRQGRIWIYSLDDDTFVLKEIAQEDDIVGIREWYDNRMILVTRNSGILVTDTDLNVIRVYGSEQGFDFRRYPAQSAYVDSRQEVWIAVNKLGCVCRISPATGEFKVEQVTVEQDAADRSTPVFSICEDGKGNLWVHPVGGGLSWFDRMQDRLVPFYDEPGSDQWRFSNKLHAMMVDRQGNLWLGTHSKGLEKVSFFDNDFRLVKPLLCNYDTNANHVRSLCEDSQHRFWIGTRDGKLSVYTSSFDYIGYLTADGRISRTGTPFITPAYRIIEDSRHDIWIASKGGGVIRLAPHQDRYAVTQYVYDVNDIYSLSHNSVYDIFEDGIGRLWVVTFGGGINYMERQADGSYRFINARNNMKSYPMERCYKARSIQRDKDGVLWVATSNGLLSFSEKFTRPEAIGFKLHARESDRKESLSNNDIYDILLTRQGRLFFATFGGGLNEMSGIDENGNACFVPYTTKQGLSTDVLVSLAEDTEGNIWIGTESGLSRMDIATHHFDNFLKQELGDELNFEESTALAVSDGRLLFGSNRGVLSFSPEEVKTNSYVPDIVFSGLKVANEDVVPQSGSVLPESLNSLAHLVLPHTKNTISLSFAALDMNFPKNIKYAYMLEGFDDGWNYVGEQRIATYTNLPRGKYIFRIKSTNGAGVWVDNERQLAITVKSAFWETPYAYLLYSLLFIVILLGGAYTLFVIYRLKHEMSVEQQLTDMKLRFFTNISHELRTPLTLIEGPVDHILKRTDLDKEMRGQLQIVERNTHRMLRLVNQILDFRKIQNNKMKLCVEQVDIVPFTRKIMENFEEMAESNKIDFIFESEQPSLKLWVDTDKVEKIIFNILSNAFKYTQPGKTITVFIHENEKTVELGVRDQGIGIPEQMKKSLFVRFETLLDKNLFNKNSTGIGLSLVKELADLHHATVLVDSAVGKGSCFTVVFLKGKEHYDGHVEFLVSDNVEIESPAGEQLAADAQSVVVDQGCMLLVEDNFELRFFLRTVFNGQFRIVEAANGVEGLEKARKYLPEIIICDIMMPGMDGITLTRELRNDVSTSHIPIVLLTAKTDIDSKLQGMELGVDSYITKPFSAVYLKARVDNLLARRQRLREFYHEHLMDIGGVVPAEAEEEIKSMPSPDKQFIDHLTEFMEKNIDNGNLLVDDLVQEMAVSRSVFFKKLKSLTGLAPIEFIKEVRVKRSAQLIESGEFNMTQIAYMVGINDPRYFSRCFKQRFGMTPTEYKDRLKKGTLERKPLTKPVE